MFDVRNELLLSAESLSGSSPTGEVMKFMSQGVSMNWP